MDSALGRVRKRLLDEHEGEGRWTRHLGDATGWAIAYLAGRDDLTDAERAALAATLSRERRLLAALGRPGRDREEAALGALGLVASARAGSALDRGLSQALVTAANAAAATQGGYLTRPAATYDPTSVTAALAYGNLLLASALRGPARILHGRAAEWLLDRLAFHALDASGAYYRTRPDDRSVAALPNFLAIAALARASRLRRKRGLRERAEQVEEAVRRALWDGDASAWLTSEEADPTYRLSVQNFAALAYAELHAASPKSGWRDRGREAISVATKRLLDGDLLLHDWNPEKGRAPWYCTGCNWQTLYVADLLDRPRSRV